MKNKRKEIYIIGNGFDKHHGLKTDFCDYKSYLEDIDIDFVQKIDEALANYCISDDDIKKWSDLEYYLGCFNQLDGDQLFDDSLNGGEQDMDSAAFWGDPQYIANNLCNELLGTYLFIKNHFGEWIDTISLDNVIPDLDLSPNALYLTFNYTLVLENIYSIPTEQILHIHGKKGEEYILGHNDKKDLPYNEEPQYTMDMKTIELYVEKDIREYQVEQEINSAYLKLYDVYCKKSEDLMQKYDWWFNNFKTASVIKFMGFSFGKEDLIYINKIASSIPADCLVIIYFYSETDRNWFREIGNLCFSNNKVQYIKW